MFAENIAKLKSDSSVRCQPGLSTAQSGTMVALSWLAEPSRRCFQRHAADRLLRQS